MFRSGRNLGRQHAGAPHNEINADPALPALTKARIKASSVKAFILTTMRASSPRLAAWATWSIFQHAPLQMKGAQDQLAQRADDSDWPDG